MLKSIDNRFVNSPLKVKIQLFLIPLLIVYFLFYFIDLKNPIKNHKTVSSSFNINEKSFKGSFLSLIKNIESYSSSNNIKILNISTNKKKQISIKAKGSIRSIKKLINKIENLNAFSNIYSFTVNKKSKSKRLYFNLDISFEKFFIKTKPITNELNNELKNKTLKLKAIISKYVLIDKKWLKKNELISGFTLTKIGTNFVELENKTKKIKLEMSKNERFTKYKD